MKKRIISTIYYYTYFTLSVLFTVGMFGGLLEGDSIPAAIELGAFGIVINPKFEDWIRAKATGYPRWASVVLLVTGLIVFGLLLK